MKLLFLLMATLLFSISSLGDENVLQTLRQKYLPLNIGNVNPVPQKAEKMGLVSIDQRKIYSDITMYQFRLNDSYERSKEILEGKGVIFVESDVVEAKKKFKDLLVNYKVCMGESEEEWQFILATHRYDIALKRWIQETTLRILIPAKSTLTRPASPHGSTRGQDRKPPPDF